MLSIKIFHQLRMQFFNVYDSNLCAFRSMIRSVLSIKLECDTYFCNFQKNLEITRSINLFYDLRDS